MVNRRKTREEHREELIERLQTDDEAQNQPDDGGLPPESAGESGADERLGDFEAISERQREEINELFRLINSEGYLTAGIYDIKGDSNGDAAVSMTVLLPSSGDVPGSAGDG